MHHNPFMVRAGLAVARAPIAALALLSSAALGNDLDWAYPMLPKPEPSHDRALKQVPGSAKRFTQAQIDNPFGPPDWFPDEHPPMPEVVARGRAPSVQACAHCHLPTGNGRPESASLAGLPADYLLRQLVAFRSGERKGVRAAIMSAVAKSVPDADARAAADYYAGLKPGTLTKVIDAPRVVGSYVGPGGMRYALGDGGMEPIGSRIIALPQSQERAHMRDPRMGFAYFVPPGSIARGEALVRNGGGKTTACGSCHGAEQTGMAAVPGIVGRPPTYLFRQLNDYKNSDRGGSHAQAGSFGRLSRDDMIDIAAYLGSRDPAPKPSEAAK